MKFLLSAAIVGTAIANSQSLHTRADTTTIGDFAVYNVSECVNTGLGLLSTNLYEIPSTKCVDTPPNAELALLPFLSYRAGVAPPPGETCFFDVFAGEGCTENYQGLESMASNNLTCQEVNVATTGNEPTVGAKSVRMTCGKLST
ncbi:hypothetical protein BDR22DRAFT_819898 [Usnea florida]